MSASRIAYAVARPEDRPFDERFLLLLDSIKEYALFLLDPDGRVATWNSGAERIKGYTADEIVGQHFSRFYPSEDVDAGKPRKALERATTEGRYEDEGWRVRKDGSRFWANVVMTALRNDAGELVGFAKVTRDLTDKKRAEEERIRLAQAHEAVRLRDEFLSIASHELNTPLTALRLQLDSLTARAALVDEGLAAKAERACKSTARLVELVETLLDVARISTGRLTLRPDAFDLAVAVREVADRFREQASAAGSTMRVVTPVVIEGAWDRVRVEQIVANLIANALKYARGTNVVIEARRDGENAVIEVTDGGPGLPDGDLSRVFERFERAASARHYGGLGLGLYVSREITTAHGGDISAANVPGGGARFTVRLPLRRAARTTTRRPPPETPR